MGGWNDGWMNGWMKHAGPKSRGRCLEAGIGKDVQGSGQHKGRAVCAPDTVLQRISSMGTQFLSKLYAPWVSIKFMPGT